VTKLALAPRGAQLHPVVVNGTVGAVVSFDGRPFSILAVTVVDGRIVEIDGLRDPDRVSRVAAAAVSDSPGGSADGAADEPAGH
jgi:hypothetical protein